MKWNRLQAIPAAWLLLAFAPGVASAGMPNFGVNEIARMRIEAISFFAVVLLVSTALIQRLWNSLRNDFPRMPQLTYLRAMSLVVIWGLLMFVVLTMISGARELMTPGAWKRDGYTYTLNP